MPATLAALAACALAPRATAQAGADASIAGWRQVVTRADFERAGIMRLGEVVHLARRWDVVTVDEYTWRAAAGALAPWEEDAWAVTLDGHEIETSLLGVLALERLPLDLGAVDSVVFSAAPALAAGTLRGRGLLEIHTHRPTAGFIARARYATGSETGDPGPFAFLPGAVPNRDRFGHDAALGVAYGNARWYAAAGLGLGVHVATDPAIIERMFATGRFPRIERTAPSIRFGLTSTNAEHHLQAGRAALDDWYRIEAYGAEIPTRSTLDHAGVRGRIGAHGPRLEYQAAYERVELRSTLGPVLAMAHRVARAQLAVARDGAGLRRAGVVFAHRNTEGPGGGPADPVTLELRAFGELEWTLGAAHRQALAVSAGVAAGDVVGGAALTHRWRPGGRDELVLLLALDEPAPVATGMWMLASRGDGWLGDAGVPSSIDAGAPPARQASADAAWAHRATRQLTLSAALHYRVFRSGFLARRDLAFDPGLLAWRGPVSVVAGRAGQVAGISGGAELAIGPTASIAAWYRIRAVIAGAGEVRDGWRSLPAHAGGLDARFAPAPSLELIGRVAVRGAIERAEYSGGGALGAAGARTGASVTADLGVQKWFWAKRLRAHIGARNIFDARSVTHPEGGGAGRAFVLAADAVVP